VASRELSFNIDMLVACKDVTKYNNFMVARKYEYLWKSKTKQCSYWEAWKVTLHTPRHFFS